MIKPMALLALLASDAALAQATPASEFAAVLQDSGHRQAVLQAAQSTPAWAHIACPAASFAATPNVGVYAPVQFNAAGAPVAGVWRESIAASGCGPALMLNVLTKVTAPSTLATGPLMPGDTIADPDLQNTAQIYVVQAIGGLPSGCADAYIANTKFAGYDSAPPPAGAAAPWRETWLFNICGAVKTISLHFLPGPQGTAISAAVEN